MTTTVFAVPEGEEYGAVCAANDCGIGVNLTALWIGPHAVVMCVNHLADVTLALRRRVDVTHDHEVVFGRRSPGCQRCRDLDAGSVTRKWGGR